MNYSQTPPPPAKKRVSFNLEKNERGYVDMEIDATSPHRPDAKPKSGILKPSPIKSPQNKNKKRAKASDWF